MFFQKINVNVKFYECLNKNESTYLILFDSI